MPTVRRVLHRSIAPVVTAIALASCSSASTYATVDGSAITEEDLFGLRSIYEEESTVAGDRIRDDLTGLIIEHAVTGAAAEEFGVDVTDEDVAQRIAEPPARYADIFASLAADPTVGERLVESNARISLVRDGVVPALLVDEFGSYDAVIAQAPDQVTQACVRHVLTATEEEAAAALERIEAGEELAAVAAEVSLDQSSPGGLLGGDGCPVAVGQVGPAFAASVATAPIGEPTGPVQTSFGFHVIQVEDRVLPTAAELESDPMAYIDPAGVSGIFTPWFNEAVQAADIDVKSSVGTWSEAVVGISPPGP